MKIFLIYQTKNNELETFDSAVVIASSQEAAKQMHPSHGGPITMRNQISWCDSSDVMVDYLGEANPCLKQHVVCSSYNSG